MFFDLEDKLVSGDRFCTGIQSRKSSRFLQYEMLRSFPLWIMGRVELLRVIPKQAKKQYNKVTTKPRFSSVRERQKAQIKFNSVSKVRQGFLWKASIEYRPIFL